MMDPQVKKSLLSCLSWLKERPGGDTLLAVIKREKCFVAPYSLPDGELGVYIDFETPMDLFYHDAQSYAEHCVDGVVDIVNKEMRGEMYNC